MPASGGGERHSRHAGPPVHLLDANVLIALTVLEHEHHDRVTAWFASVHTFAVCPMVQGALVRFLLRLGEPASAAHAVLQSVERHPRFEHWPEDVSFTAVELDSLRGHRQVTDAYLAALARAHGGVLATLDAGLHQAHPDVAVLVP